MSNYYSTSDLNLASAIIVSWYQLSHIQKDKGKGLFFFEPSHKLAKFTEDYFLWKIRLDPMEYSGAIKTLKNYLYNTP